MKSLIKSYPGFISDCLRTQLYLVAMVQAWASDLADTSQMIIALTNTIVP